MDEINKQNDILVSTILNPQADTTDLIANGINGTNTGLLSKDDYKQSKFILKAFTDDNGVFNNEAFEKVYNTALNKYTDLAAIKNYEDLSEYTKWDKNDIYAPLDSLKTEQSYLIHKVKNPLHQSEGITTLFGKSESDKSNRELALMHKVWDSENEKWLDYTAEDQGFLGLKYLGRQSLVYAQWDEDGIHFDKTLGRDVQHKKGEWKTDDNGEFYCETIGNKLSYGKEFVAFSDILTKEDSWANKIDFFDSDDKHKSIGGTVMKTIASIAPYLFPVSREIWGGVTAAVGLSTVMPTFAKMVEGIAIGDEETKFTKSMNTLENYWSKFNSSHSDEGNKNMINFETMMDTVSDVFGQLYQMRAAASLSNLYNKTLTKAQKASAEAFEKKFANQFYAMKKANPKAFDDPKIFGDMWKDLAEHTPEMKTIIDKQTKLSKRLSLGYMALTSSADVYSDAILHGYDRRMAGLAGLAATAGQYAIMMNNRMGDWFLDATTGYKENVSRNIMKKTLQPYYDKIKTATDKLATTSVKEEKIGVLANAFNTIFKDLPKKTVNLIKYGGEEYWKRAMIEGVEEVTEEAVMDATKGIFDTLSWLGVGKNAESASFGGWKNAFSAEGAQRYLMNFIGGVMGGALFEFQGKVIQPHMDHWISKKALPEARYSIIREVMNGNTQELLDEIDRMTKSDNLTVSLADGTAVSSKPGFKTDGLIISNALKEYVKFVDGIIGDSGIRTNNDVLLEKVVRDRILLPVIESSGLMNMIEADFTKMVDDFVSIQAELKDAIHKPEENTKDEKKEKPQTAEEQKEETLTIDSNRIDELKQKAINKKQEIINFLNGENAQDYLKTALLYLHPDLRQSIMGIDKYSWTKSKYDIDYSALPQTEATLSKERIDKEYAEWKEKSNDLEKFRTVGTYAFDELEKEFSSVLEDYAKTQYKDIRKVTIDKVLRDVNWHLGELSTNQNWRDSLIEISKKLVEAKLPGVNLEEQLGITDKVKEKIISKLTKHNDELLTIAAKELTQISKDQLDMWKQLSDQEKSFIPEPKVETLSKEDVQKLFEQTLMDELNMLPVETITPQMLNDSIKIAYSKIISDPLLHMIKSANPEADNVALKTEIDKALVNMGFSPLLGEFMSDDIITEARSYITKIISPKISVNENINLADDVFESYLESLDIIDNEVARKIKSNFYTEIKDNATEYINSSLLKLNNNLIESVSDDILVNLSDEEIELFNSANILTVKNLAIHISLFLAKAKEGIDKNTKFEDIIEDWAFNPTNGVIDVNSAKFQLAKKINSNIEKDLVKTISDKFKQLPSYNLYEIVKTKTSKENPLFKKLRTFGMKVFDGDDLKIFDLLETESKYMSKLPDLGEYIRLGITKEAIDNFLIKLDLLKAIAIGMEDTGLDPDHQIAYNILQKRFANKWNNGKDADKYKTISTDNIVSIINDIDLLEDKLMFAKTLIETNTESKLVANQKTLENFENALLQCIENAGELTIRGVSVLPPLDELNKLESNTEKLGLIEHTIYSKCQELLKNGATAEEFISSLMEGLKVNKDAILSSGLLSFGLNSSETNISPYDFFVWITSIAAVDSNEFLFKYKNILKQDSYKYVPFFVLEYGAKLLYSFAADENKIHDAAIKWLYKDQATPKNQEATRLFFLNGIAGSGKTSAVMSLVSAMLDKSNIWIAAPNDNQSNKLYKSLASVSPINEGTPVLNKYNLLSKLITDEGLKVIEDSVKNPKIENSCIKFINTDSGSVLYLAVIPDAFIKQLDADQVPNYIFIDEETHFNLVELKALDAAAKKYGIKIIGAGDTLLKGATIEGQSSNINDIFAWKSPAMMISVRSSNIHEKDNTDLLLSILRQVETIFVKEKYDLTNPSVVTLLDSVKPINYYLTDSELHGNKVLSDSDLKNGTISVEDIKIIANAAKKNNKTIAIIANLDSNNKIVDDKFKTNLEEAGLQDSDYELYSPDDFSSKAVLGAEADYVIVNDMPAVSADNYQNLITFYTYQSRSLIGSLIKGGNYINKLKLLPTIKSYTSDYSMPGLDKLIEIKQSKIDQIDKIIKDYTVENRTKKSEPGKPNKIEPKPSKIQERQLLEKDELQQIDTDIELAEKTMSKKEHSVLTAINPFEWKPDHLYGYSFYNRTGIFKDRTGNHYSRDFGTSLDLDGLFGEKKTYVNPKTIRGFVKFKNLISLYDQDTEFFKQGLDDDDILYFFWKINPDISEAKHWEDRKQDILAYLNEHLTVFPDIYVYAKKYNSSIDDCRLSPDADPNALKNDKDLWLGFGKRFLLTDYNKNIVVNQYITSGVLPKVETLNKWGINADSYLKLITQAQEKINKTGKLAIFKLPKNTVLETTIGLQVRQSEDQDKFISLRALELDYGISFEKDREDNISVYLIQNKKAVINDIESFEFLHYIASTEKSPLSYEERIKLLEKDFVKDGKLTVSGKYFTVAGFTKAEDPKYKRVLILEPSGWSYINALHMQNELMHKTHESEDVEEQLTILERCAKAMSQASLMRLLTGMFKTLNAIDANGLAIGDGVLPYVEYTALYLDLKFKDKSYYVKILELISQYKESGRDFDMQFISDVLRSTRYGGLFLITTHLAIGKDDVKVLLLPEEGARLRDTRDLDFNLDDISFKEFGAGYEKTEVLLDAEHNINLVSVNLTGNDYNFIGLSNHFFEMPKFNFTDEMFDNAALLKDIEATLKHSKVDYSNESIEKESVSKLAPTTSSFAELKKLFNPETDIIRSLPSKGFYKNVKITKEDASERKKYYSTPELSNGFSIRKGDTILIYGDITHTYHISYVDKKYLHFEYDMKDGKNVETQKSDKYIPFKAVSAIVSREVNKYSLPIKDDWYSKEAWADTVKSEKYQKRKSSKIISENNLSEADLEKLFKSYPTLVVYPVRDSDTSVLSPLNEAENTLEEGTDYTSINVYPVQTIEDTLDKIKQFNEIPDLNGIVVLGLIDQEKSLKFATNRKEFINNITEGYIKLYISYTDNPKLIELVKSSEKSKTPAKIATVKEEPVISKQNEFIDLLKNKEIINLLENANLIYDFITTDTREDLKEFKDSWFFKYLGKDKKYHIAPKYQLINSLEDSIKSEIIDKMQKTMLSSGQIITVIKDNSDDSFKVKYIGLDSENNSKFVFEYVEKSGLKPISIDIKSFDALYGIKYIPDPISTKETITEPTIIESTVEEKTPEQKCFDRAKEKLSPEEYNWFESYVNTISDDLNKLKGYSKLSIMTALLDYINICKTNIAENPLEFYELANTDLSDSDNDYNIIKDEIDYILSHNERIEDLYSSEMERMIKDDTTECKN